MTTTGVWIGVDPGEVRVGVAASDPEAVLAVPVETVARGRGDVGRICSIAAERRAVGILVGLPRALSGAEGASAARAREFARELALRSPAPVRMVDERLTTVTATRDLRASGQNSRQSRPVVDQVAATVLLQAALDQMSSTGSPVGELVSGTAEVER